MGHGMSMPVLLAIFFGVLLVWFVARPRVPW
jgi:hypothetical protein